MFTTNPVNSQPLQKCENSSAKVDNNGNPQMPQNYASSPFLADLDNFGNSSYQQKHQIDNRCKSSMDFKHENRTCLVANLKIPPEINNFYDNNNGFNCKCIKENSVSASVSPNSDQTHRNNYFNNPNNKYFQSESSLHQNETSSTSNENNFNCAPQQNVSPSVEDKVASKTTTIQLCNNEDNSKNETLNVTQNDGKKGEVFVGQPTESHELPKRGMFQNLRRTVENFLPNFTKSNGRRSHCAQTPCFVNAISVPDLSAISEPSCNGESQKNALPMQSKSIAFGLNRVHEEEFEEEKTSNKACRSEFTESALSEHDSSHSGSTVSKSSFQKNTKNLNKGRPTRFEPKTLLPTNSFQMGCNTNNNNANTLPPNLTAIPQYGSCLCLMNTTTPTPPLLGQQGPSSTIAQGMMSSSDGSASLYSGSSVATLPMHALSSFYNCNHSSLMDSSLRHRYLTYGTSAQLQQEYGKVLPWPTLTEFRLRRKFRRLKRRARKLIGGNLFSSKSFLVKRFGKQRRNSHSENENSTANLHHFLNGAHLNVPGTMSVASRSSSLTSLLDLIEEANKNIINSYNRSPGPTHRMSAMGPPKCPPRLKRTQSSINVFNKNEQTCEVSRNTGTLPNFSRKSLLKPVAEEEQLWKPKIDDYQIAFIEHAQQTQQNSPSSTQRSSKTALSSEGGDTVSVKSLDSYFGPSSLPSVSGPSLAPSATTTTSPRISKTLGRNVPGIQQLPIKSKSRTLMVRSHFEINNGTIYLEDSDWEMCSEVSELNSLNHIESQTMDSSMLGRIQPETSKFEESSKSSLESSKVSIQSSSSTSGFSELKSDPSSAQLLKCSSSSTENLSDSTSKPNNSFETVTTVVVDQTNEPAPSNDKVDQLPNQKPQPESSHCHQEKCHNALPTCTTPSKKKPEIAAKPKLACKPSPATEPIYAKPNKSKYPPKHCCIARPAQPPPETPRVRTISTRPAARKVVFRKKVKAPAPPLPPSNVGGTARNNSTSKEEVSPQTKAATLKLSTGLSTGCTSGRSTLSSKSNTISTTHSTAKTIEKKSISKINNNRTKFNLTKKTSNSTSLSNVIAQNKGSSNKPSTKLFNSKNSSNEKGSRPPTVSKTAKSSTPALRSASKSPLKALINRFAPRGNNEEGSAKIEEKEKVKTSAVVVEQSNETNAMCNQAKSAIEQSEPIYSNIVQVENCTKAISTLTDSTNEESCSVDVSPENATNVELENINVSVVSLIDKFNKLNDTLPELPVVSSSTKMVPNKNETLCNEKNQANDVCFESIISSNSKTDKKSEPQQLENEFQQYLQQLRSNSPDNLENNKIVDHLCSELIHKFEETKTEQNKVSLPESNCSTSKEPCANASTLCSTNFSNPNWLFLFFLNNQRQLFKEILHEMLSTIQNQSKNQSYSGREKNTVNPETNAIASITEMNEFRQLIQMLQSTIANNNVTNLSPQSESVPPISPVGAVTANVITPVIVTETKELKNAKKISKTKNRKEKEKKNSLPKKSKNCSSEQSVPEEEEVKDSDMDSKDDNNSSFAETNVKSSNRFVNKIVLNNSINQFNFTMNQDGTPSNTGHQQPNLPQASIVNLLNDQSTNQAANVFDINVNNSPTSDDEQDNKTEPEDQTVDGGTNTFSKTANDPKFASPSTQHRTVLQITDASGRTGPTSTGFLSSLRYRLEKKRNKKLMERFKKQQLAASQVSLLDAIKEAEELTTGESVESKVTLANTSKLEVKVEGERSSKEINHMTSKSTNEQQQKMGTLKRLLLQSRGGARRKEKETLVKREMPREESGDEIENDEEVVESDEQSGSSVVSKLDQLVARHRNSRYIPQISEPCPTGLEYTLHGTMERQGGREGGKSSRKGHYDDGYGNNERTMSRSSGGHARVVPSRSLSERNFRSISVIKLNEMDASSEALNFSSNDGHRVMQQRQPSSGGRFSSASAYGGTRYYQNGGRGGSQIFGGSHLNLSSSSLSSSVILPSSMGSQYSIQNKRYPSGKQHQQYVAETSDDFDDEQSTTSSRSKMVTFTLPRSFKPKSRTLNGGALGASPHPRELGNESGGAGEEYISRRYNLHRFQQQQPPPVRYRLSHANETDFSETDANETDFTETETETENEQYCLSRCRLNERYFRHKRR